jgi:ketosteroid isomerase-like protein
MRTHASALIDLLAITAFVMTLILLSGCERKEERAIDKTPADNVQQIDENDLDSAQDVVDAYQDASNAKDVGRVTGLVVRRLVDEGEEAIRKGWNDVRTTRFEVLSVEERGEGKMWVIGRYDVELEDGTARNEEYWVFPVYKENGQWRIDPHGAKAATDEWMKENKKGPYAGS